MFLLIFAHGKDLANPFKSEAFDDFRRFEYYCSVFDSSDTFKRVKVEEIAGGTMNNGLSSVQFLSTGGEMLTLEIDGGFPVPELADMTLMTNSLSEALFHDIVSAFEKYHETEFTHFEVEFTGRCKEKGRTFATIELCNMDISQWRHEMQKS